MMTTLHEPMVHSSTPLPNGYTFIRKGNVYKTRHARRLAHDAGATVYRVHDDGRLPLGIRVPTSINQDVQAMDAETRASRSAATARVDQALLRRAREHLRVECPLAPADSVERTLTHALKKRTGRVGRSTKLDLAVRVRLAVRAHIRHVHTDYDALLKAGIPYRKAREQIQEAVSNKIKEWGGMWSNVSCRVARKTLRRANKTALRLARLRSVKKKAGEQKQPQKPTKPKEKKKKQKEAPEPSQSLEQTRPKKKKKKKSKTMRRKEKREKKRKKKEKQQHREAPLEQDKPREQANFEGYGTASMPIVIDEDSSSDPSTNKTVHVIGPARRPRQIVTVEINTNTTVERRTMSLRNRSVEVIYIDDDDSDG